MTSQSVKFLCKNAKNGCCHTDDVSTELIKHEDWFCKHVDKFCGKCECTIKNQAWFEHCLKKHPPSKFFPETMCLENLNTMKNYEAVVQVSGIQFFVSWQAGLSTGVLRLNIVADKFRANSFRCELKISNPINKLEETKICEKVICIPEECPYYDFSSLVYFQKRLFEGNMYNLVLKINK